MRLCAGTSLDPQGFDAGKTVKSRKRHILGYPRPTWQCLRPAYRIVTALRWCSSAARVGCFPFIERNYGDGGYRGAKAAKAAARTGQWRIEVVERSATAVGFEVLPKRWIVDSNIRLGQPVSPLARDFERYGTNRCRLHSTCDAPPLSEISVNLNRNLLDWHSRGGSNGAVPSAETLFVKAEHVLDGIHDGRFAMLEAV